MGEIKGVTSGTGFSGVFADETAIGDDGVAGHNYKPISRWTEYPFQLYREGDTEQPAFSGTSDPDHLYFGLLAYHAEGIKEVEFFLNNGEGVKVTEQEINPYTNLPEYCVRVNKADVIVKNGEETNNMELRAVVRPNSGIPRMHQHDKDVILGEDMALLTGYHMGFSGGKGDFFFDKNPVPGEFSMIGTVLKENSVYEDTSELKSITAYMLPDGNDTNDGTKESPVKTIGRALEVIRDLAMNAPNRLITEPVTGNHYVDVTRGEIILLGGTYTAEHFGDVNDPITGVNASRKVGWSGALTDPNNTDPDNRRPLCKRGWFIVKGDPDVAREDVRLTLTDAEAQLNPNTDPPELPRRLHSSDFCLLAKNPNLNCLSLQHLLVHRPQTKVTQTELGFRLKSSARDFIAGHTAESDLFWMHDVTIASYSYGQIHSKGAFIKGETIPDQRVLLSGSAAKPSKIFGGDENSIAFTNLINVDVVKNDGDNLKQMSMAAAVTLKGNNGVFGEWRRIWFDPNDETQAPYTKFNGYYAAIRYPGEFRGGNQEFDANGSRLFEHGTLKEYIRIHNLNSPAGVTLSWPQNPQGVAHPVSTDPNASIDDFVDDEVSATGTIWQKINQENFLDLNLPWQEDPVSDTNYNQTTYRQWGQLYNEDEDSRESADPYFGDNTNREPPTLSTMTAPFAARPHLINPQKASPWFFTDKSFTDSLTVQERIAWAYNENPESEGSVVPVGRDIFDPDSDRNENNKFYESIFCTMLKYEDSNLGITAWGQILFDATKPIAANPAAGEVFGNDWGVTQDFCWRLAGTTWPSAGYLSDIEGVNLSKQFKKEWPFARAQFLISPDPQVNRGQFNVAWAAGITAQGLSAEHMGSASRTSFDTPISPDNTHPIGSWCLLGGRDTNHVDSMQYFASTRLGAVHRVENALFAYCNFVIDGQGANCEGAKTYHDGYHDVAFVNNVWANIPIPTIFGFNWQGPSKKHVLFYHNTFHNLNIIQGIGLEMGGIDPNSEPQGQVRVINLTSQDGDHMRETYGTTVGFLREHDAMVYRNNYISKWSHEFEWIYRGTGKDYRDCGRPNCGSSGVIVPGGITWPYINNGQTIPVRVERNFRWDGGPVNGNPGSQLGIMNVLPLGNPPLWKGNIPQSGGDGIPTDMTSPYQLDVIDHQPADASPLKGGGTLGMENQVSFDLNRKRRIGHSTIGAYEVDSSYLTANNNPHSEYVAQTSPNSSTNGEELFPSLSDGSTLMSFSVDFANHQNLYAKRIKVRATKEVGGEVEERFSDNIIRLERDISTDLGVEARATNMSTFRNIFLGSEGIPDESSYLFTPNQSSLNPVASYYAPEDNEFEAEPDGLTDLGSYEPYETFLNNASQNKTWLNDVYDVSSIQIFGSTYQTVQGNRNKIRIFFGEDGSTRGITKASAFHTAYAAAGGTLAIPFPDGTTFFVDKAAGGMTAHGSSLESYLFTSVSGTTVSLADALPTGEVLIKKPTGL